MDCKAMHVHACVCATPKCTQFSLHSLHGAPTLCKWVTGFTFCHSAIQPFQHVPAVGSTEVLNNFNNI